MKILRLDYDPTSALLFYEESLSALGALSERTWHDRLEVIAEGPAAKLWNEAGTLHQQELLFASGDAVGARDAASEIFPGCPLTFRLFEALRPAPLAFEKAVISFGTGITVPDAGVMEKLWRNQHPATRRWRLMAEPRPGFHFSLVAVVRCEIQAIDQHWSLHRIALALPGGESDDLLAREISLLEPVQDETMIEWPVVQSSEWLPLLQKAVESEMTAEIEVVHLRQQQYLRRELERLDEYFAQYEQELTHRSSRAGAAATSSKAADRLAAARAEHARRRIDQVARHEICIQAHIDALLLTAEPCWQVSLEVEEQRAVQALRANYLPRARRWFA